MIKHLTYLIQLTYDRSYKGYVADVVNLYGCMSQGKTKEEAMNNAKKAITAYMKALEKTTQRKKVDEKIIDIPYSFAAV